jgi:hypothetical protein
MLWHLFIYDTDYIMYHYFILSHPMALTSDTMQSYKLLVGKIFLVVLTDCEKPNEVVSIH